MDLQHGTNFYKVVSKHASENSTTAAAVLGLAACAWLLLRSSKDSKNYETDAIEIPTPCSSLPYFGHMFALGKKPITQLTNWNKELGPIISVKMGVRQWVVVSDPFLAHEIFNVNGRFTSERPQTPFFSDHYAMGGKGIAGANPSLLWKKTRAAVFQILSPKNRPAFDKLHIPEADMLIENLLAATDRDGSVDVMPFLLFTAVNVIATTCFGKRAESTDDPLFKNITEWMHEASHLASAAEEMSGFLPILSIWDVLSQKRKRMQRFVERRTTSLQQLVAEVIENDVECFTKSLLQQQEISDDNENLLVTLSDMALAGGETTAVMLGWSMAILCRYPKVQKSIREELDQFIRTYGRLPTFEDRDCVPYCISVQKECMRYRSITHLGLPHVSNQEIICGGYRIPKGATLFCNMQAMHRNESFYSDAHAFVPDRYLRDLKPMHSSANSQVEGRDHFNFGWGRRTCPGAFLAELEIFNVYVRLFSKCVIEPVANEDGVPVYPDLDTFDEGGVVTLPYKPVMRVVRRTDPVVY
ncbi:cytochrome P450 [Zychaea mexicana]|uniref:cytochrome P450 n=1 Tax=Zychaea mexicana TaxID=64656 RepID=UPI0022FE97D4|nr:cytochrome P450 [Zychaea mexicana]KAI9496351.1 cytochrome P450 [Zychaea mexicana]